MKTDMRIGGSQIPRGEVRVSGAKNSATRMLAAAMLTTEPVRLTNFPTHLVDVAYKIDFMRELGCKINLDHIESSIEIMTEEEISVPKNYDIPIRTTYLLAAGQIIRRNSAYIPYPGGCNLGARGYDLHIMVWEKLGCKVTLEDDYIKIEGELRGGVIDFPISTVGGTENAVLCAVLAKGDTEIRNAYITPEVNDLIKLLKLMGAKVDCRGNSLIKVQGAGGLLRGASCRVMADRIEALTWIIFSVLSKGDVTIRDVPFEHMEVPLIHLKDAGIDIYRNNMNAYINENCISRQGVQPFELACGTHPGIISDMQSFYTLLAMAANGKSKIYDYRYPKRIAYAAELNKMCEGALQAEPGVITVMGPSQFIGKNVQSTDLRGSMSLILAAFIAKGESYISDAHMALRGYNDLPGKLKDLNLEAEFISK